MAWRMPKLIFSSLLAFAMLHAPASVTGATGGASFAEMLPARTLHCTLARALNLDPSRAQSRDEIQYEGSFPFSLHLPSIPKRQTPPPDPTSAPEPVDPATAIINDPAGLAKDGKRAFDRVIDLWPVRVEMARSISPALSRIIIISDIDTSAGSANLFMAPAADAASMDMNKVYLGSCRIVGG